MTPETFVVTLQALPDSQAPIVRLRQLLKQALRSYRLRCTRLTSLKGAEISPEVREVPVATHLETVVPGHFS